MRADQRLGRRQRRQRRKLLEQLATAEHLRRSGYFSEVQYAAIALDVLLRLEEIESGGPSSRHDSRFVGREILPDQWNPGMWIRENYPHDDENALRRRYGEYDAPPWILRENLPLVVDPSRPIAEVLVAWTPAFDDYVKQTRRLLSRTKRVHEWLEQRRSQFPLFFNATFWIVAAILTAAISYLVGKAQGSPKPTP